MTVRHILLTVAALAVLGLGVYLFFEVRATPATADVPRTADKPVRNEAPETAEPEPAGESTPSRVSIPKPVRTSQPTATQNPSSSSPPPADDTPPTGTQIQKLDSLMSEASKAYDKGDFDEAKTIATKALTLDASNVRMLRIMVSASCIEGSSIDAQKHYLLLPPPDREQMKTRCDRYGVTFNEK